MPISPTATAPALAVHLSRSTARNRHERRVAAHHERAAWRVPGWLHEVPIGRSKFYLEVKAGRIKVVKAGCRSLDRNGTRRVFSSMAICSSRSLSLLLARSVRPPHRDCRMCRKPTIPATSSSGDRRQLGKCTILRCCLPSSARWRSCAVLALPMAHSSQAQP
jgi:hypothetical protein